MIIFNKYTLTAVFSFCIASLQADIDIKIGNGNNIGSLEIGGDGKVEIGNNCVIGDIATANGFTIVTEHASITLSNKQSFKPIDPPTKVVKLQGTQKPMVLENVVATDELGTFVRIIAVDRAQRLANQIMLCDQAIFDAGIRFAVKDKHLVPILPTNTTLRFNGASKDKPLCTITQMRR
jgi:hypothetical protein